MDDNSALDERNEPSAAGKKQTPLTRAMATIRTLRERLAEQQGRQPIAVIGTGLRLPGGIVDTPGYWDALAQGRDLVGAMPEERKEPFREAWDGLPQRGGFLQDDPLAFDADFFGISPREARHLDPQHRLLLEVTWEALEDAAISPGSLSGAPAGLYLGIMWQDYRDWLVGEPDAYWTTGNGHNFAAGRVAYALGLTGPAMSVDTACSSSLVAVHLAVQALRRGECETALAAGANLMLAPNSMRLVQETRSLAPDGLCKTFDARANGFTRGEGVGAVVLKRLDRAVRDGDRIHGVIRGTAVNQDGRSGGFTVPNVLSQVSLIEAALEDAGVDAADIGFVETHGTGTSLGDPIEMEALMTVLGRRNGGAPLPVGAVKTNFGHLEGAAGVAGLIKAMLCVRNRKVPPVVHFRTLNPRIDLSGSGMSVPSELQDWSADQGRCAGVSSFGMSGTNAHVVLGSPEEAGTGGPTTGTDASARGFMVSAKNPEALRELAARYAERADALTRAEYPAFCFTATYGRARLGTNAQVIAAGPQEAAEALRALASGRTVPEVTVQEGTGGDEDVASLVSGTLRQVIDLPSYPWRRRRYAPESLPGRELRPDTRGGGGPAPGGESPLSHEVVWGPVPAPALDTDTHVVLAGDDAELLGSLVRRCVALGLHGTVLCPGTAPADLGPRWQHAELPAGSGSWTRFWSRQEAEGASSLVMAFAAPELPEDAETDRDPAAEGGALCHAVATAVAALHASGRPRTKAFALTRRARRVEPGDDVAATSASALHGLAPVLALEAGAGWGGVVDLPAELSDDHVYALLAHVTAQPDAGSDEVIEDVAAVRGGGLYAPRLRTASSHVPRANVREDASYLVTGGLGAVGRELSAELVDRGARHLLLIGRRPAEELDPGAVAALDALRVQGAVVHYRGGGCESPERLRQATAVLEDMPPLRGIVHAAGTLDRAPVSHTGADDYASALSGKATAAWWLHLATRDQPLDFFVLVSSVSAVWGTENCSAYSAANGALDGLAAHRRALGLPAVSVAYGPWALGGAGMADDASRERFARLGVGELSAEAGRAALTGEVTGVEGHIVACSLDAARLGRVLSTLRPRGLLAGVAGEQTGASAGTDVAARGEEPAPEPAITAELAGMPQRARSSAARGHVARIAATQLGHDHASAIRHDAGFLDLGLDSIMAVDLAARLSEAFEITVTVSDIFDHPTVARLAAEILTRTADEPGSPQGHGGREATPTDARPDPRPQPPASVAVPGEAADDVARHDPVAIVGLAGRFPGADSADELWDLLEAGRDGVGPVPASRWKHEDFAAAADGITGIITDQGGFLNDIDSFDAPFFDIPAREADHLDPQQRLLLESAWHALEDGGIDPRSLERSLTGVFVGISYADYARVLARGGPDGLDAYYSTGTALNAAAGRLSYTLGLNGPAMAVDTACSSSLVAIHLAVRSLRSGESDTALAGGVNLLLDPSSSLAVSRAHMLSPDGRCRSFSADANGFVRAEGCGVLVLKRLSDAQRDGDRVYAVIRGSAVNQDGASSGLTAPNGTAQEAMLRAALADAGIDGKDVGLLEAHGTGTALGDPVELTAAWRVLGPGRKPGQPLRIGSVKSNIGHCESAAGMAAVFKTLLALRHGLIPANLHFTEPNPHVPWDDMNVQVVDSPTRWRAGDRPRVAGVSGFGFTGTNAHLVLSDLVSSAPVTSAPEHGDDTTRLKVLPLSAPSAEGLGRLSSAWQRRLVQAPEHEVPALAATAGMARAHFPFRRALVGHDREELLAGLAAPAPGSPTRPPRIAFLFAGQGSQYFGMGRDLYESEAVFRDVFDRCDDALAPSLGASLTDLVLYGRDKDAVKETRVTQPALVALEVALAALWGSWGVEASVVMGHSVGEVAAAIHAGVMDLETGLTLISERARLMQETPRGAMLAVVASEERVLEWIADRPLDLAAVNAPEATVVAGAERDIEELAARLRQDKVRSRRLSVSHAFHSRLLDPALSDLAAALAPLRFSAPEVPVISNVTGQPATQDTYDADYWCRHARNPVRFHDGARQLSAMDIDLCLEIGPDRTLVNLIRGAGVEPPGGQVTSLRRGWRDRRAMLTAAGALYVAGQDLRWQAIQPQRGGRADAPLYPFARERHWAPDTKAASPVPSPATTPDGAPPWGVEVRSPAVQGRMFVTERSTTYPAHLTDHRLFGTVSVPGASQTATVLSALGAGGADVVLEDLHFPRALVLHDGERYPMQILQTEEEHGGRTVGVYSLLDADRDQWQQHLGARIVAGAEDQATAPHDPRTFLTGAERRVSGEDFYRHLRTLGYHLGTSFRWIQEAWLRGDTALVRFAQPPQMNEAAEAYEIHPGLLDSCLQSSVVFAVADAAPAAVEEAAHLAIPFAAARVAFTGRPEPDGELWAHISVVRRDGASTGDFAQVESADLHLFDERGATVLSVEDFRFRAAPRTLLQSSLREGVRNCYTLSWTEPHEAAAAGRSGARRVAVLGAEGQSGGALAAACEALGHTVTAVDVDDLGSVEAEAILDARFAGTEPGESHHVALRAAQTLAASLRNVPRHLPYVVICRTGVAEDAPVRETLWGLLASLEAEQPDRRLLRIALTPDAAASDVANAVSQALEEDLPEGRVEVGAGTVRYARLRPYQDSHEASAPDGATDGRGAALITGGLGALGLSSAMFLVRQGITEITLMARSGPDAAAREAIDALVADGARVSVVQGDVTDQGDCRRAVAEAGARVPIRTVLHLAGMTDDGAFEAMDQESFAGVFAAKAEGAAHLAAALGDQPLDAFVLFSSASSVLGAAGQTNYAAANGCLAGLAERLRASGLPAVCIDWGLWTPQSRKGMADSDAVRRAGAASGITPLTDEDAEQLLRQALRRRPTRLVAVALDTDQYARQFEGHPRSSFVSASTREKRDTSAVAAPPRGWLRDQLAAVDPEARGELLLRTVRELAGEILGDPTAIDDTSGFTDMGLDSIMVIDLRTRLSQAAGTDLPATVALDHPDVTRLAVHLDGVLFPTHREVARRDDGRHAAPADDESEELPLEELIQAVRADVTAEK